MRQHWGFYFLSKSFMPIKLHSFTFSHHKNIKPENSSEVFGLSYRGQDSNKLAHNQSPPFEPPYMGIKLNIDTISSKKSCQVNS